MFVKAVGISCVHMHEALLSLLPLFSRCLWYSHHFSLWLHPGGTISSMQNVGMGVNISHSKLAHCSLLPWQALILQDSEHLASRARESKAFGHLSPQWDPAASILEGLWGRSKGCWLWQSWRALGSFEPRGLLQFGLFACWMDTTGLMMEVIVMLMEMTCLVAI